MTRTSDRQNAPDLKTLMVQSRDLMRPLMQWLLQEVPEQEMTDSRATVKCECCEDRQSYRSGQYPHHEVTRVGTMGLRLPAVRRGPCATPLFGRYQRSEKALVMQPLADLDKIQLQHAD